MTSQPLVSVIIPTYNRAAMLVEAIDSVCQQGLGDCEIIVVDDGSTDDTEVRVGAFGDRVRYVRTTRGGVAHARNVGARHAAGRYLTFLDSDDRHYPYTIALQLRLLEQFPHVALVCAEMSGFDDHGFFERYHLQRYHRSAYRDPAVTYDRIFATAMSLSEAVAVPESLLRIDALAGRRGVYLGNVFDTYLLNLILCQNSVMIRRDVAATMGERNTSVRHWQEVDYLLRITRHHPICFVDVPTYQLRYHAGQVSGTAGADGVYRWIRKQQILLRVVERHAFEDADYYQTHRQQIDRYLAHLHRAVAVPMLLCTSPAWAPRRYVTLARRYLSACVRYGYRPWAVQLASRAPRPLRRLIVGGLESARETRWWVARQLAAWGSRRLALLVSHGAQV